jgi:hypothetical protein
MTPTPAYSPAPIHSTLPRPWEDPPTFHEVLYDWMGRAPWLGISLVTHLLAFFVLMAIPWQAFQRHEETRFFATPERPPDEEFVEPEPEPEPPIDVVDEFDDPHLVDATLPPDELSQPTEFDDQAEGDPEFDALAPFDFSGENPLIGIGGNAGGKYGKRGLGGPGGRGGNRARESSLTAGLTWLADHQSPDGAWDADGFAQRCPGGPGAACADPGQPTHDVGLTGLALLAFLGEGSTTSSGDFREVVTRGIVWLRAQQDPDTGLIGERMGHDYLYDHALATLAICENYYFTRSPLLKPTAQRAVDFIQRARNPYGAWRYDAPPIGDNDTSVTGWMLFALAAAKDADLVVDPAALDGGLAWLDEATDPATGRVGYATMGSLSSRTPANEHYPREKGEALTAVGLLCRIFLGQTVAEQPVMAKHAELLRRRPPEWDPEGRGCDMYYWYYGTYAAFQMGGSLWRTWQRALEPTLLGSQRRDGHARGSWDPVGPWGHAGGRVYSTALMSLCLEVDFRYSRVLGGR